ncbi:hypothetical protein TNCT_339731 [Trichonephila clavata]|uniref:Uncharacterized protein n=1 Tax=Trichonephila clavata TaxID=2740835 RepID=A0A8X6KMP1_TRICU|nr:hypothetical protein TNCT_339731 [Trichonephila clavata]
MYTQNQAMFRDIADQFSKELEPLRLPLEHIPPPSQRPLELSQWIHYILLSNHIRLTIKLTSLIQKNVDALSAPHPSDIQHWLDALKPEGKISLVTEFHLLLFMLHLRFLYEKFPVKMFEIKLIALKVAESHLNALDQDRSQERLYSVTILGLSAMVLGGCLYKLLR